jgi:Protein of unknown function (DUF3034)
MQTLHFTALRSTIRTTFALIAASALSVAPASAQEQSAGVSGKLIATSGVSQVEGAAGGGLAAWSVIGGYGTVDQIGASAFVTHVGLDDFRLQSSGAAIGFYDRFELSFAQQAFDTKAVGAALGLGAGYTFRQDVFGAKVRLIGDAVYDQDRWLPQIAVGVQHKRNHNGAVLAALGAKRDQSTDVYVAATKIFLRQRLVLSGALRFTQANQLGILGFGGPQGSSHRAQFEGSAAFLIQPNLALGVEARTKRDYLGLGEQNAYDVFVAYFPLKNVSITLAYVDLGKIVVPGKQRGVYASLQLAL